MSPATAATLALAIGIALGGLALGLRAAGRAGSPGRALLAVAAVSAVPAALILVLGEAAVSRTAADPVAELRRAASARMVVGQVGLALALPVGLAAGLWGGVAAGWRSRRAGERARLSASAAGFPDAGQLAAAVLERTGAARLGAVVGVAAAAAAVPVSLATWRAGAHLLEDLAIVPHLRGEAAALALQLAVTGAARILHAGALLSGGIAPIAAALAAVLHIGSSRRRNLAAALHVLQEAGQGKPAIAAVTSALAATGKPGPGGPLAIAAVLLALAVLALWCAERPPRPPSAGELAGGASHPARSPRAPPWRGRDLAPPRSAIYDAGVDVLELPDEVAIGGAEARAAELCDRSERTLLAARELAAALLVFPDAAVPPPAVSSAAD